MMYPVYSNDELHGWWTNAKKATVSATKKVTRVAKKAMAKAAGGVCKAAQSQTGQAGAAAAGAAPNPTAQGISQGMMLVASLCPTPKGTVTPEQAAALETAAMMQPGMVPGAVPGTFLPASEPFYKNPVVIGGGALALLAVAYVALKK